MLARKKMIIRLVVIGAVIAVLAVGRWWLTRDDPPFDDSHLRVVYHAIPNEQNALTHFMRAAAKVVVPEDRDEWLVYRQLLKESGTWDPELAAAITETNEGLWADVERGLACSQCQFPACGSYGAEMPEPARLRRLARVGAIRARVLFESGREREALDQAMTIVRVGCRVENARGPMIAYLVGITNKTEGLRQLRHVVAATTLPPEQLLPYVEQLDACGASAQGLADALRIEYTMAANTIDSMLSGRPDQQPIAPADKVKMRHYTLKPNRTKRLFATDLEQLIASADKPYAEASLPEIRKPKSKAWWMVKAFVSGNGVGKILYRMLMPAVPGLHRHKCRENCAVAATRILVALRCYQLEHGELPETLDALVPECFEAVPLDDFDGKPMKYSREKRVVYAVGTDLTDNGGIAEDDRENRNAGPGYDVIYKIEF